MKAYDLLYAFKPGSRSTTAPPTVYRALRFLIEMGLAHRIESLNAFIACQRLGPSHPVELLICDCCGRVDECQIDRRFTIERAANARGFKIESMVLEVRGVCETCRGGQVRG
jgi:Fur family zinc uptake transcriptional regulator